MCIYIYISYIFYISVTCICDQNMMFSSLGKSKMVGFNQFMGKMMVREKWNNPPSNGAGKHLRMKIRK